MLLPGFQRFDEPRANSCFVDPRSYSEKMATCYRLQVVVIAALFLGSLTEEYVVL
jgi:hypothetical protein